MGNGNPFTPTNMYFSRISWDFILFIQYTWDRHQGKHIINVCRI